jgi:hypothetical protein
LLAPFREIPIDRHGTQLRSGHDRIADRVTSDGESALTTHAVDEDIRVDEE